MSVHDAGSDRSPGGDGSEDRTRAALRRWFAAEREEHTDNERRAQLDHLETSLLQPEVMHYIVRLVREHHVELGTILSILAPFRLRWVDDPHVLFAFPVKLLDQFPRRLRADAKLLSLAAPLLREEWTQAAEEIQRDKPGVDAGMLEQLRASAVPHELPASASDSEVYAELLRSQTVIEQLEVADLGLTLHEAGLSARKAMQVTIAVLEKAADTMEAIDWRNAEDAEGRPIYGRHRRQGLFVERECASALLAIFEHETDQALYDYVGALLAATFPSLAHWAEAPNTRFRDRVKQLVGLRWKRARGGACNSIDEAS